MPALPLRPGSPFTPFTLSLPNNATLTGIAHIPPMSSNPPKFLPLLVAMHGGTCTAVNYDVDAAHSAALPSAALSIPFVAIDRPCYGGTTSFLPLPDGTSFYAETARWEHEFILPLLWAKFGKPNGCSAIVTTNHSMAVGPAVILGKLYAQEPNPAYPLAGLILSGFGTRFTEHDWSRVEMGPMLVYPPDLKALMMVSEEERCCADPAVVAPGLAQSVPMPLDELMNLQAWQEKFLSIAEEVRVPVMYGLGEHDWLWEGSVAHVEEVKSRFPNVARFDGSLVRGGPHALEWGWCGQGWYARCFGWAMEVCAGLGVEELAGTKSGKVAAL